ncbi:gamma-glutamylcyclotransferase [Bartonella sp. M0280]|uniref:gamma-glutamylcyclotransferase n=1 Tax=Bartonella apihabitans TaxID=2750929 RepID=UPI0018DC8D1F|nr:gamma-glutamylcyclotransferase [Bartonella apihabitans]MBI0026836.1 gamma-glutamylcyclotransferase [Bartonella apihabitans]MBI0168169.1 gamma-glutamylcyclotransferase [Bartonella apihabitans]
MHDFWVFGYGSLMWNPGFHYDFMSPARLYGYHRSLCIYSNHYRGTVENPGLVLGLDRGGCCDGLAFHVPVEDTKKTYDYLIEREQVNSVYIEKLKPIHLKDGRIVNGLFFVADQSHEQYAKKMDQENMATIIRQSHGLAGSNIDYVVNTAASLRKMGIPDKSLEKLAKLLQD